MLALVVGGVILAGRAWLADNPQHDPWAPLDLADPPGWATAGKLAALRTEPEQCRAVLDRSGVAYTALEPAGQGPCRREDRTRLIAFPYAGNAPSTSCPVAAGMQLWLAREVQPAARDLLGSEVVRVQHFGAFSCRRIYGGDEGPWSQHATANAIDIAGFVLEDGRQVGLLADWDGDRAEAAFLRRIRDGACEIFGTVLSPDYNAAHADHFHFDQEARGFGGVCR